MSVEGMRDAWGSLARSTGEFYERTSADGEATSAYLRRGEPLGPEDFSAHTDTLDVMLAASEQLRLQADAALRNTTAGEYEETATGEYEQIAELLLAAAAVDAMLARDILALDRDAEYSHDEDSEDQETGPSAVFEEGQELLRRVDALFNELPEPVGGGSPYDPRDRQVLIADVEQVTIRLTDLAEAPTRELVRGLMKVATGPIPNVLSAVQHLEVVSTLDHRANVLAKHAPRFVREHVLKIVTLRLDGTVVDRMAEKLADWFAENVNVENLLKDIADSDGANRRTTATINDSPSIEQNDAEALLADLTTMRQNYAKHMDWIGNSAKWLRRGAKPLSHLGAAFIGPLSYGIAAGIFFVGIGYVGYSLTDRLDARRLGFADRVEGVVRLVDRQIEHRA